MSALLLTLLLSHAQALTTSRLDHSDHFFITQAQAPLNLAGLTNLSCRENIAQVICLVGKTQADDDFLNRACLPGSQQYAQPFEQIYDQMPANMQKMFCSLRRIFIEKDFFGTAYATVLQDQYGKIHGAAMGIRQSVLDLPKPLAFWASWKEQLSFGGHSDHYEITPDLPQIISQSKPGISDFLYFVVAHEFGHIFDFTNLINNVEPGCDPNTNCRFAPDSWGAIGWLDTRTPKPANQFPLRSKLCFYWCEGQFIDRSDILNLYRDLDQTDFISIYATTQAWDDFADSLAYYLMNQNTDLSYVIDTRQGATYNIVDKLKSPQFAAKHQYIEQFLRRTDIKYP